MDGPESTQNKCPMNALVLLPPCVVALHMVAEEHGLNVPPDATVTGNWIVHAGLLISNFQEVTQRGNTVSPPDGARPPRPADILLRPSRYTPGRGNLGIFNRARREQVEVDLASLLPFGQPFRIVNALDFYGTPVLTGTFDGKPVSVSIPVEARTGQGEFCAFVVLPSPPGAAASPGTKTPCSRRIFRHRRLWSGAQGTRGRGARRLPRHDRALGGMHPLSEAASAPVLSRRGPC